ncbi:hypothetical protein [Paeniglutamicibacter terrestris]|uniref:Uncharacterized protein n=1 Tax=Paeniglutamicibacter terrestris TaxID=2723403 RepID=A0ABX1G9M3_9MICC|nr:hypothetical protein [Paeniglutamicibacter terrestris]NKG22733.1 hypothetical protein [Paeniglutamicibacter terrestris]
MANIPKKYAAGAGALAIRMVVETLSDHPSDIAACKVLAPKLDVGAESLCVRRWVLQA